MNLLRALNPARKLILTTGFAASLIQIVFWLRFEAPIWRVGESRPTIVGHESVFVWWCALIVFLTANWILWTPPGKPR